MVEQVDSCQFFEVTIILAQRWTILRTVYETASSFGNFCAT